MTHEEQKKVEADLLETRIRAFEQAIAEERERCLTIIQGEYRYWHDELLIERQNTEHETSVAIGATAFGANVLCKILGFELSSYFRRGGRR